MMNNKPLIVDAHEDMAWNMAALQRDYTRTVADSRSREVGKPEISWNGDTMLGWDAYQQGRVAVVFGTLFAAPASASEGEWGIQAYEDQEEAHQLYRHQVDLYHQLVEEHPHKFTLITNKVELDAHLQRWQLAGEGVEPPVGLVILMEAADAIQQPAEVELWWGLGVRLIGPAWRRTVYCGGTGDPGPLTDKGFELLERMADFDYILDISHMDEAAVLQSLDTYTKRIVASHANVKALLPGTSSNRFLSDRVIEGLLERDGMIGLTGFNLFLDVDWKAGDPREGVTLDNIVAHIDYICQMAGDAQHVGFGSDFDGGFGLQSVPAGLESVADLQKLAPLLAEKGYSQADVAEIFGGNWLRVLSESLPGAK